MAIALAILALSLMIIVHEAGHFFVARWSGMRVDRFSLGFGPPILKWTRKGTQFQIAPILFGGFVHIVGMNPHEDYDEKDPSVYPNRPTILRFLTIFAGPFTNMLFAIVLAFAVLAVAGADVRTGRTLVSSVLKDSVADGQLQAGDLILTVNGLPVTPEGLHNEVQRTAGAPLALKVARAGQELQISLTPRFKDETAGWLLGINMQSEITHQQLGLGRAAVESLKYPVVKSKEILGGLWEIVTGKEKPDFHGPVDITTLISQRIQSGWVEAFELLAALNVYLCIFNLLPFPALDGGRLAFLSYELATRRRPNAKIETAVHLAGGLVLVVLMIVVTYKEVATGIRKLFS